MSFVFIDWLVVGAFFAILLAIPFVIAKRDDEKKGRYFNGGGSMPWWLIGISMTAAMTSTNSANLFTQLIRENGMSGNWVWWAFLTGGILTVFVYAKLWHRLGATTDIAFYELRYSGKPATFLRGFRAVYLGVIYNLIVMATVLLGAVKLGTVIFGVSASTVLVITAVASVAYSCLGGIKGTICTDFFLFATIVAGAVAVMYFGCARPEVGGFAAMMSRPEVVEKLNFLPDFSNIDVAMAVFVVPVAIQWWNVWYSGSEPGGGGYIVQRMLTAKTPDHALGGTLFAQIVQYGLRPWPWYVTAFASIILFPDLASIRAAFPHVDPALVQNDMAYPAMITFVPSGWLGLVAASLMGALFSTIAAHLSMGANYVANDVWKRFVNRDADDRELVRVARVTSLLLMAVGCLLSTLIESARSGFDILVQIGAGTGVIFLLRWFWMRINAWTEIVAMAVSFLTAVFIELVYPRLGCAALLPWQRLLVVMAVTTVAWVLVTFLTPPTDRDRIASFRAKVGASGGQVAWGLVATSVGCLGAYALMFAVGYWIYGRMVMASAMTAVAVIAGIAIMPVLKRINRKE